MIPVSSVGVMAQRAKPTKELVLNFDPVDGGINACSFGPGQSRPYFKNQTNHGAGWVSLINFYNVTIPRNSEIISAVYSSEFFQQVDSGAVSGSFSIPRYKPTGPITAYNSSIFGAFASAYVGWPGVEDLGGDNLKLSVNLAGSLQDVVNQGTWNSGDNILVRWGVAGSGSTGDGRWLNGLMHFQTGVGSRNTKLTIKYVEPEA